MSANAPKTSLVTGAAGFIGRHLVQQLAQQNVPVRGFDIAPAPKNLPDKVEWISGSILDKAALRSAMQGAHHIYHLAAIAHLGVPQTQRYDLINHIGTRNVIDLAAACHAEHLIITSTEVILRGWQNDSASPLTENEPLPEMRDMAGPYCRSKLAAEIAARQAMANGHPITILYPTVPIGAGDINLTAPSAMIKAFINNPPPAYLECIFNFVSAKDVARGHILAAQQSPGQRYILGGETVEMSALLNMLSAMTNKVMPKHAVPYALAELTARMSGILSKFTGKAPLASLEGVRLAKHKTLIDSRHAKDRLNWQSMPAQSALEDCVKWLKYN